MFTTRPDTLMGVTYHGVAAEHPLAQAPPGQSGACCIYRRLPQDADRRGGNGDDGEEGNALGLSAIHPVTGEAVPVWVANFVLMGYGTGAVMAVPGHDQRDWEFARKHGLPIRQVFEPLDGAPVDMGEGAYVEKGRVVNSAFIDGLEFRAGVRRHCRRSGDAG